MAALATVKKRLSVIKMLLSYAERNDLAEGNDAHSCRVTRLRLQPRSRPWTLSRARTASSSTATG